jgi:hypothetical protein
MMLYVKVLEPDSVTPGAAEGGAASAGDSRATLCAAVGCPVAVVRDVVRADVSMVS